MIPAPDEVPLQDASQVAEARWGPVRLGLQRGALVAGLTAVGGSLVLPWLEGPSALVGALALGLGIELAILAAVVADRLLVGRSVAARTVAAGAAAAGGWTIAVAQVVYARGAVAGGPVEGLATLAREAADPDRQASAIVAVAVLAAGTTRACVGPAAGPLLLPWLVASSVAAWWRSPGERQLMMLAALGVVTSVLAAGTGAGLEAFMRLGDAAALDLERARERRT